jgi:hypothetical protein
MGRADIADGLLGNTIRKTWRDGSPLLTCAEHSVPYQVDLQSNINTAVVLGWQYFSSGRLRGCAGVLQCNRPRAAS